MCGSEKTKENEDETRNTRSRNTGELIRIPMAKLASSNLLQQLKEIDSMMSDEINRRDDAPEPGEPESPKQQDVGVRTVVFIARALKAESRSSSNREQQRRPCPRRRFQTCHTVNALRTSSAERPTARKPRTCQITFKTRNGSTQSVSFRVACVGRSRSRRETKAHRR